MRPVVLLGESHDNAEHHRWQLHTIAALHALQPNLVLGFEMFPRRVQKALDEWVAGELGEEEFLKRSEWNRVWGFDARLYMPIFDFARMHRVPMLALNVDRDLVARVGERGWASIPESEREGVGDPAAPSAGYREALYESYSSTCRSGTLRAVEPNPISSILHSCASSKACSCGTARWRKPSRNGAPARRRP